MAVNGFDALSQLLKDIRRIDRAAVRSQTRRRRFKIQNDPQPLCAAQ